MMENARERCQFAKIVETGTGHAILIEGSVIRIDGPGDNNDWVELIVSALRSCGGKPVRDCVTGDVVSAT